MDWLTDLIWYRGRFMGIEWNAWKVVGWLGNLTFFSRFLVQWYATERQKRVVVPAAFWWLSLVGATLLFMYALFYRRDSVFTFAYAFTWIPYVRNLVIHRRTTALLRRCNECGFTCDPNAHYCANCGHKLGT
ncbi:MAG: lipid-A-disaccharide synthase N-terminal domain-containing protein [Verrucomicrobiae bacterium]|nr:lipid-A-disaccharide synthase N-terminal domain-containing protein [Verrucomicrobiae bacterium]